MLGLILMLAEAMLFWFITVFMTQDHSIDWKKFALWTILIHMLGNGVAVLLIHALEAPVLGAILSLAIVVSGLYIMLGSHFVGIKSIAKKVQILAIYFVASLIFSIVC